MRSAVCVALDVGYFGGIRHYGISFESDISIRHQIFSLPGPLEWGLG